MIYFFRLVIKSYCSTLCKVFSLAAMKSFIYRHNSPISLPSITDVCGDCKTYTPEESTVACTHCCTRIHVSCAGKFVTFHDYHFTHLTGINKHLYQSWNSTPVLCTQCRRLIPISAQQLGDIFDSEVHSAMLAQEATHMLLVQIDATHRLFLLVYQWLDFQSPV